MKKMYSKALAVMCAVTMALPSAAYTNVYADGEVPIVENNEEGGKNEGGVEYANGENVFNFKQLKEAGTWGPTYVVDNETGKATFSFGGQYDQIFFNLPEGIDPERISKIQLNGENVGSIALKVKK